MAKFKKLGNTIAFKLTLIICLLVIPVNILVIFLSNSLVDGMQKRLMESYKNELAIYMTKIDNDFHNMQEDIIDILNKNWFELTRGEMSGDADISRFKFWQELKSSIKNLSIVQAAYIKPEWSAYANFTYKREEWSYDRAKSVQNFLETPGNFEKMNNNAVTEISIDGTVYLCHNISNGKYSFGYIIDGEALLKPLRDEKTFENEFYFIEGGSKTLINFPYESYTVEKDGDFANMTMDSERSKYYRIRESSVYTELSIVRLILAKELDRALPLMERLLQMIAVLLVLIIPVIWLLIRRIILRPMRIINNAMTQIEHENLEYRIGELPASDEFIHMRDVFNNMADQIRQLTIESYEKDIEKLQIETTNLRLQINPHMLLNSLNMIYSLSQSKNYKCIQDFTLNLVEYFRYALKKNDLLVTIESEMNFVKSYLEIQKIRFPGAFTSVYDIEDELFDRLIPPLLIQNFVENSIKYGLKLGSEIEILIIIRQLENKITISICDTGMGMDEATLQALRGGEIIEDNKGRHIGIWNCRRRLKMMYGDKAQLKISSAPEGGTQVWIELPVLDEMEDVDYEAAYRGR